MLTEEDDVEIHALKARGWSVAAISRHTGRDRKTIAKYLRGEGAGQNRRRPPSYLEPFRDYIAARFVDDPHIEAMVRTASSWPPGSIAPIRRSCVSCGGWSCGRCAWSASTVAASR
jgi:transposase